MKAVLDDYPVIIQKEVAWGHMDAFAHVNNVVYFRYFEDVRIACFEQIGAIEHMKKTRVGPILASTRCDFRCALEYPDTIHIGARVTDIREKRFTMHYRIYSQAQDRTAAEGEGLVVYVDYNINKSCPVPESIANAIRGL